jgi:hypothetical protein
MLKDAAAAVKNGWRLCVRLAAHDTFINGRHIPRKRGTFHRESP